MKRLFLALSFLLIASSVQALPTFYLDDPYQTVVRPMSGFLDVEFFGTLTLDIGDEFTGVGAMGVSSSAGDVLYISAPEDNPDVAAPGYAYRFSVRVYSDSVLGLYDLDGDVGPAYWGLGVAMADGSDIFLSDEFSVEVIAGTPVPEPTTMLLLGTGLIGLAGLGRKKFFKK